MTQKMYWPFNVLSSDQQTEQHKSEIRFYESAIQAGFAAYMLGSLTIGAESDDGRSGIIIRRGKKRWEVVLFDDETKAAEFLPNFETAGEMVLKWLRG